MPSPFLLFNPVDKIYSLSIQSKLHHAIWINYLGKHKKGATIQVDLDSVLQDLASGLRNKEKMMLSMIHTVKAPKSRFMVATN